jgi:Flp pilus assembly protein TadD
VGYYHAFTQPIDQERSLAEYQRGLRLAPDNVELLTAVARAEIGLGRNLDGAMERLARAAALDPRSAGTMRSLAMARMYLGQYAAADSAADRAVALAPAHMGSVYAAVFARLAEGDLARARLAIRSAEAHIDRDALAAQFASGEDLFWVLDDEQQRRVLTMPPSAWQGDPANWATIRMYIHQHRHDSARAVAYADTARMALEEQLRANPSDAMRHALLGVALAHLGRKDEAIREGRRATELTPASHGYQGYYQQHQLARIYLLIGEPELALEQIEPLTRVPYFFTPGRLRVDPMFDPLRKHPQFLKLIAPDARPPAT